MASDLSEQIYYSTTSYPWSANSDAGSLSDIIAAFSTQRQHQLQSSSLAPSSKFFSLDVLVWAVIVGAFLFMTHNNTRSQMHNASKRAELDSGKLVYAYDCSAGRGNRSEERTQLQQHADATSPSSSSSSTSSASASASDESSSPSSSPSFFDSLLTSAASMASW